MRFVQPHRLFVCLVIAAMSGIARPEANQSARIREFDLKTTEKLGRSIYEHDMYAAGATDILFKEIGPPTKLEQEKIRGWIVRQEKENFLVRFIKEVEEGFVPAYDVAFTSPQEGTLTKAESKLSSDELAQFRASQVALKSVPEFFSPRYNTVVLPDVDRKGFLVYALAATTDPDLILIGGHYRMTVSPDGKKVEQVDRLFRGFLVLSKSDVPKDVETAGLVASHVVSDAPIETHVFVSLLHNQPLFIVTMDGKIWKIDNGVISEMGDVASQAMASDKQ